MWENSQAVRKEPVPSSDGVDESAYVGVLPMPGEPTGIRLSVTDNPPETAGGAGAYVTADAEESEESPPPPPPQLVAATAAVRRARARWESDFMKLTGKRGLKRFYLQPSA
jgi:hypothetical protein